VSFFAVIFCADLAGELAPAGAVWAVENFAGAAAMRIAIAAVENREDKPCLHIVLPVSVYLEPDWKSAFSSAGIFLTSFAILKWFTSGGGGEIGRRTSLRC
jgi:hypothetical protein